ncbi:MAG: hypothetical protein Hyperionvirus3_181 [Hyperionvirus sp.]|uniref:Uncharacterized protein n=1 Tax=Hyperionvirus sp. TaxID=2487770 RepID=A0A3G5A717_9VIRU|nr:MAG: hypothetical protein Hyperionvirus3_181 [Hyperionvirus sp.]
MSLTYAIDESGEKISICDFKKGCKIYSPLGKELIAKKGPIKVHHYAHKYAGDRDQWLDPLMTKWHKSYQNICKSENVEYRIEKDGVLHIADIYNAGLVIELQHSYISQDVIDAREKFYGNMIWLFDYTCDDANNPTKGKIICDGGKIVKIEFKTPMKNTTKPTFFDIGNYILQYLCVCPDNQMWCFAMKKKHFINHYLKNIIVGVHVGTNISSLEDDECYYEYDFKIADKIFNDGSVLNIPALDNKEFYSKIKKFFDSDRGNEKLPIRISNGERTATIKQYLSHIENKIKQLDSSHLILFECNNYIKTKFRYSIPIASEEPVCYSQGNIVYEFFGFEKNNAEYFVWFRKRDKGDCREKNKLVEVILFDTQDTIRCDMDMKFNEASEYLYLCDNRTYLIKDELKKYFMWSEGCWKTGSLDTFIGYRERRNREIREEAIELERRNRVIREKAIELELIEEKRKKDEQDKKERERRESEYRQKTINDLNNAIELSNRRSQCDKEIKEWLEVEFERLWIKYFDMWREKITDDETKMAGEIIAIRERLGIDSTSDEDKKNLLSEMIQNRFKTEKQLELADRSIKWKFKQFKYLNIDKNKDVVDVIDLYKQKISSAGLDKR